jgi:hypothetical protein
MLERFVKAQEKTYAAALAELRAGEKRALDLVGVPADAWSGHVGVFGVLWHRR